MRSCGSTSLREPHLQRGDPAQDRLGARPPADRERGGGAGAGLTRAGTGPVVRSEAGPVPAPRHTNDRDSRAGEGDPPPGRRRRGVRRSGRADRVVRAAGPGPPTPTRQLRGTRWGAGAAGVVLPAGGGGLALRLAGPDVALPHNPARTASSTSRQTSITWPSRESVAAEDPSRGVPPVTEVRAAAHRGSRPTPVRRNAPAWLAGWSRAWSRSGSRCVRGLGPRQRRRQAPPG